jgi:hypothetical protein
VSEPRVGPINNKLFTFKCGNIFAGICTLVLSLCIGPWSSNACIFPAGFLRRPTADDEGASDADEHRPRDPLFRRAQRKLFDSRNGSRKSLKHRLHVRQNCAIWQHCAISDGALNAESLKMH